MRKLRGGKGISDQTKPKRKTKLMRDGLSKLGQGLDES